MRNGQQGGPIANLSAEERASFRALLNELQSQRKATSVQAVEARTVLGPHLAAATPGVQAALLHLIERDERGPAFGETAPDFALKQLGSDERVSLSEFRGKRPVGLIFGSYT